MGLAKTPEPRENCGTHACARGPTLAVSAWETRRRLQGAPQAGYRRGLGRPLRLRPSDLLSPDGKLWPWNSGDHGCGREGGPAFPVECGSTGADDKFIYLLTLVMVHVL